MTVGELIAKLQEYKPHWPVLVDGYEGGFDVPLVEETMVVRPEQEPEEWKGRYARHLEAEGLVFVAVIVGRDSPDRGGYARLRAMREGR